MNTEKTTSVKEPIGAEKLFLGFIGISGNTSESDKSDIFNMSMVEMTHLHMVISEVMKSEKQRNDSKVEMGLKMAINHLDDIYERFKEIRLVQDFIGEEKSLTLGYVGLLDNDTSFEKLSNEIKKDMLRIAEAFNPFINEVFKHKSERNEEQIGSLLGKIYMASDDFYEKNKGLNLFHEMYPME